VPTFVQVLLFRQAGAHLKHGAPAQHFAGMGICCGSRPRPGVLGILAHLVAQLREVFQVALQEAPVVLQQVELALQSKRSSQRPILVEGNFPPRVLI
jgi:hypothetical protein